MSTLQHRIGLVAAMPDEFRAAIIRRIKQALGLTLIGVAALGAGALATWSVKDPSLSHATSAPVRNLVGLPGAIFADLAIQLLGVSAIALVIPIAAWGWRLLNQRRLDREPWRMVAWIIAVPFAAGLSPATAQPRSRCRAASAASSAMCSCDGQGAVSIPPDGAGFTCHWDCFRRGRGAPHRCLRFRLRQAAR
jgi:S-DNA-T family DNA segregation ATPase FtsK/SpoIIIE